MHSKQNIEPSVSDKILLHACCAPCSSAIVEYLAKEGLQIGVFYSNSNIYSLKEYEVRKNECKRYAEKYAIEFIEDDYDHELWRCVAKGLENEPERGKRCLECFRFRLERAAKYANRHGYNILTTTLASSRWKDLNQVNEAGEYACSLFPNVRWWGRNWRKDGLQERRNFLIKDLGFYNQLYCGCEFSFRKES